MFAGLPKFKRNSFIKLYNVLFTAKNILGIKNIAKTYLKADHVGYFKPFLNFK